MLVDAVGGVMWGNLSAYRSTAENLSFVRAAEALGVTRSAVSYRVAALERELGTQLLNRTTASVRITDPGRRLLRWIRETDRSWEQLRAQIDEAGGEPGPTLRVALVGGAAPDALASQIIRETTGFGRIHWAPAGHVSAERDLAAGEVDVVIETYPPDRPVETPADVHIATVDRPNVAVALPSARAARYPGRVGLGEARDLTWILAPSGTLLHGWQRRMLREHGIDAFLTGADVTLGLLSSGTAAGFVTEATLVPPGMVVRPLDQDFQLHRTVAWHSRRLNREDAHRFHDAYCQAVSN